MKTLARALALVCLLGSGSLFGQLGGAPSGTCAEPPNSPPIIVKSGAAYFGCLPGPGGPLVWTQIFPGSAPFRQATADAACQPGDYYQNSVTGKLRKCLAANTWGDVIAADASGNVSIGGTILSNRPGPGCVAMGDSITQRDSDAVNNTQGDSYITYAMLASGKAWLIRNSGAAGNTSAQMLARWATDVTAYSPNCVAILAGTNDTNAITQTLPNLKAMIKLAFASGIRPILATIPPRGTAAIPAPVSVTATPSTTGGTLAAGTYGYRVSAINSVGETLASTEVTATTTGTTGSVLVAWPAVLGAVGYKIYGRTSGAELLMVANTAGGTARPPVAYTDTGAVTPSGALPVSNTTAVAQTSGQRTLVNSVNAVISALAQQYGLPLVDFYTLLVDPTTGLYKTGYTSDGTHPTAKASKLMGQAWATATATQMAQWVPYIAQDNSDGTVLYNNPLFTNNNGTNPTGWGPYGGPTATESITTDVAVAGNVYSMTRTDANPRYNTSPTFAGWSVGDVLSFSGYMKITNADAGGGTVTLYLQTQPSTVNVCKFILQSDTPAGWTPFYCEGTVPVGATSMYIGAEIPNGPATLSMAQFTVRDLTVLGLRPFVP